MLRDTFVQFFSNEGVTHGLQDVLQKNEDDESDIGSQVQPDDEDESGSSNADERQVVSDESETANADEVSRLQSRKGQENSEVDPEKNIKKRIEKLKKQQENLALENYKLKMQLEKNNPVVNQQAETQPKVEDNKFTSEQMYRIKLAELEQQKKVAERMARIAPSLEISRKKYEDFDSSISEFSQKFHGVGIPEDVSELIPRLKNAGDVLYHFAKNSSDFMDILQMDSIDRQRAILEWDINMQNKNKSVPAPKTITTKQTASKTFVNDGKEPSVRELRDKLKKGRR